MVSSPRKFGYTTQRGNSLKAAISAVPSCECFLVKRLNIARACLARKPITARPIHSKSGSELSVTVLSGLVVSKATLSRCSNPPFEHKLRRSFGAIMGVALRSEGQGANHFLTVIEDISTLLWFEVCKLAAWAQSKVFAQVDPGASIALGAFLLTRPTWRKTRLEEPIL